MSEPKETIEASAVKVTAPHVEVRSEAVLIHEKAPVVNPLVQYAVITTITFSIVIAMVVGIFLAPDQAAVIITTGVTGIGVLCGILKVVGDYHAVVNSLADRYNALVREKSLMEGREQQRTKEDAEKPP